MDQWKAEHMDTLPLEALEEVSDIWNACLQGMALPAAWCRVRVVTIPKDGGGYRGLSIATMMWRAGMSDLLGKLTDWAEGWLPSELYGGIKNRSADNLHLILRQAIDTANQTGDWISGGKTDIKKCFDTVAPEQAIEL